MSVLIKGMDMPKSCFDCGIGVCICNRYYDPNFDINDAKIKRHPDCPLIEVKATHGRLIDENAVMREFAQRDNFSEKTLMDFLMEAPTVLEAEGKDDG